ncbi:hypothetical protein D6C84_01873, partial [Aureobasidium pullulans]
YYNYSNVYREILLPFVLVYREILLPFVLKPGIFTLAEKYDCGHLNKEGDKSGSMHVCCTSCFVLRRTRQRLHRHSTSALGFPSALTEPAHPIPRHLDSLS